VGKWWLPSMPVALRVGVGLRWSCSASPASVRIDAQAERRRKRQPRLISRHAASSIGSNALLFAAPVYYIV